MLPIIQRIDLLQMPPKARGRICKCSERCIEAVTITTANDDLILCRNDARRHMYDLINVLDVGRPYTKWSCMDEQYIVDLVNSKGMYSGINRDIANALGKTYSQAKNKTRRMKLAGLI